MNRNLVISTFAFTGAVFFPLRITAPWRLWHFGVFLQVDAGIGADFCHLGMFLDAARALPKIVRVEHHARVWNEGVDNQRAAPFAVGAIAPKSDCLTDLHRRPILTCWRRSVLRVLYGEWRPARW